MPDRMSENMPERVSYRMSESICIYVIILMVCYTNFQMACQKLCQNGVPGLESLKESNFAERNKRSTEHYTTIFPLTVVPPNYVCWFKFSHLAPRYLREIYNVRPPSDVSWFRFAPVASSLFVYHKPS